MNRAFLIPATLLSLAAAAGCHGARAPSPPTENIFRYALHDKIPGLDPLTFNDQPSLLAESLVYETLYSYDYTQTPPAVVPLLAAALPDASKDNRTFTIRLKPGVHFQDDPCFNGTQGKGRELVAADVAHTLKRISELTPLLKDVVAVDAHTVRLTTTRPLPRLALELARPQTVIVAPEAARFYGAELRRHAVGTGPFHIVEAELNSRIVAVRNPGYHQAPLPKLDKVVLEVIAQDQPAWLKFLAGELEVSRVPRDAQAMAFNARGELSPELLARGVKLHSALNPAAMTVGFNMEDPLWGKNKRLRQAFALALDVPRIIQTLTGGQAVRAQSLIGPGVYGHDPARTSRWQSRNLELARKLLAEAGYPGGKGLPPLNYPTLSDTNFRQRDELLMRQLAEVGIVLKPDPVSWPQFLKRVYEKQFTVAVLILEPLTPDFDTFADRYHSSAAAPGPNFASYRNPVADRLLDEIRSLPDGPARFARIGRFLDLVDEELPYIPVLHRVGIQVSQPWVEGHTYLDEGHLGPTLKFHRTRAKE